MRPTHPAKFEVVPDQDTLDLRPRQSRMYGTFSPRWSPDGTRIVFSGMTSGVSTIGVYLASPKRTGATAVVKSRASGASHANATWLPDGKRIVFQRLAIDQCDSEDCTPMERCPMTWTIKPNGRSKARLSDTLPCIDDVQPLRR